MATDSTLGAVESIHEEINSLMLDCINKNKVPYIQDIPLPQDVNIVNGRHIGDINKVLLELKASQIGAKSLKWIYAPDAEFIGLKLKENEKPLTMLANRHGHKNITSTQSQPVYLVDQFTDISLENALKLIHLESDLPIDKQKRAIAQNMIKNIAEYDAGTNEIEFRENKRKNISTNLKDKNLLSEVFLAYNNVTKNYDDSQKIIFDALNNYYIKQETGLNLKPALTVEQKNSFISALKKAASSPRLTQTLADCFLYSERMTHYNFTHERIYTQDDLNKEIRVHSPKASRFEPKNVLSHEKQHLREIDREIKPRHITHKLKGR